MIIGAEQCAARSAADRSTSAIGRDPRLVVCVDVEQPPYAYVQVQGVAEVTEELLVRLRPTRVLADLDVTA